MIASPTENAQARYIPQWIEELKQEGLFRPSRSAVVLCNEALLQSALHAIPDEIEDINITMGFPMKQTPVYNLICALTSLHTAGSKIDEGTYKYAYVLPILKHPFMQKLTPEAEKLSQRLAENNSFSPSLAELQCDEVLTLLFSPVKESEQLAELLLRLLTMIARLYAKEEEQTMLYDALYREALFRAYTLINRLKGLIHTEELQLKVTTFNRLLQRMLSTVTIPFNGEPVQGLQVMGVLETRNLDFDNLFMASVNEGQLPKGGNENSFIPHLLRKVFGMTTIEHKIALFAYYFYRVLQRASHITLLYNTASDGLNRGEQSRFLLQLLLEAPFKVVRKEIYNPVRQMASSPIRVEKTPEILRLLRQRYDCRQSCYHALSPTALNTYIDCPLKFYFRYLVGLKEIDNIEEEIDQASFGTIFHKVSESLYTSLADAAHWVRAEGIEKLLSTPFHLERCIDRAFNSEFFKKNPDDPVQYNGIQWINRKVIYDFVRALLKIDRNYAPFQIVGLEQTVKGTLSLQTAEGELEVEIGGLVDRLDCKEGTVRIVDYKTGGTPKVVVREMEQLFISSFDRPSYLFQVFLYSILFKRSIQNRQPVKPMLLYVHKLGIGVEKQSIRFKDQLLEEIATVEDEFMLQLQQLLEQIFDPSHPFVQTEDEKICTYCPFKKMCSRI